MGIHILTTLPQFQVARHGEQIKHVVLGNWVTTVSQIRQRVMQKTPLIHVVHLLDIAATLSTIVIARNVLIIAKVRKLSPLEIWIFFF